MKKFQNTFYLLLVCLLCCKKPFNPSVISSSNSFLVVEGTINSGNDSTTIKLSKTVKLDSVNTVNPVLGANVTVESDQGSSNWELFDNTNTGFYSRPALNLPAGAKYRLRISTTNGEQYLSDFIPILPTPLIDSIGYTIKDTVMQLYVNTHDPANNTHYYRWEYAETWQFASDYSSAWVYDTVSKSIVPRRRDQAVHFCFGNDRSSNIITDATTQLKQDLVYQFPLTQIALSSEKVEAKYSILLKQYALPAAAYQFYQNLAKNTEHLGSIFDAQPSQLNGNIHCISDPNQPVIGYLTVTNVQSKRIFLTSKQLNTTFLTRYPYYCELDNALYMDRGGLNTVAINLLELPITNIPVGAIGSRLPPLGFTYSSSQCVDCTIRGTTVAPSFWK